MKEVATNSGRNGIGLWIATRLATVEKTAVTQCANNIVCHSLGDLDKKRLAEIMGDKFAQLIGDLPAGEAIVKGTSSKCRFPIWVKVLPEAYPIEEFTLLYRDFRLLLKMGVIEPMHIKATPIQIK